MPNYKHAINDAIECERNPMLYCRINMKFHHARKCSQFGRTEVERTSALPD